MSCTTTDLIIGHFRFDWSCLLSGQKDDMGGSTEAKVLIRGPEPSVLFCGGYYSNKFEQRSTMNVEGVSDTVSGFLADLILGVGGWGGGFIILQAPEYVSQHFLTFILLNSTEKS